jgi:hypothetical protein
MIASELKPCPFCGSIPLLEKKPLWSEGGHGYYNCYEFDIHCINPVCGCRINLFNNNSIYHSEEEAIKNVINAWNERVQI